MYNSSLEVNMFSSRRKGQPNQEIVSQLDDFDEDAMIGNAASSRQQNVVINEGTVYQEFTVKITGSNLTTNESSFKIQTWKGALLKRLISKLVRLLTRLKIGYRTKF